LKELDFTPRWYRTRAQKRMARRRRVVLIVLLASSMGAWSLWTQARIHLAGSRLATLEDNRRQQTPMADHAALLAVSLQKELGRETLLTAATGGAAMHQIVADLARRTPETVYLNALSFQREDRVQPDDAATEGVSPKQRRREVPHLNVSLLGHAAEQADVGRFVRALSESPTFSEVKLSYARTTNTQGREVREFEIMCRLPSFR
jgi:Tfp pilus assembly protein PilN